MSSPSIPAAPFIVRPTSKFVIFSYVVTIALVAAAYGVWHQKQARVEYLYLILAVGALGLFSAIKRHIRLRFTSLSYDGHSLKYQDGMMSKSTRLLNLAKIQDVRVDQGVIHRMFGIGTVTFETAGEGGRLVMHNVDGPHEVAHRILGLAKGAA